MPDCWNLTKIPDLRLTQAQLRLVLNYISSSETRNFDEQEYDHVEAQFVALDALVKQFPGPSKRNFDEIDQAGFGTFVKQNVDEIDNVLIGKVLKGRRRMIPLVKLTKLALRNF